MSEYTYKTISVLDTNENYSWSVVAVFQRSDGAFAVVTDSGCSCNSFYDTEHWEADETEWFHSDLSELYRRFDNAVEYTYYATVPERMEAKLAFRKAVSEL